MSSWRSRRKVKYYAKCSCGRTYNRKTWKALKNLGVMHIPADEFGPESNVEMRNCACGSTMAIDSGPEVSRDTPRYYVTIRFTLKGEPQQLVFVVPADSSEQAKRFARMKLPKGAIWIGARATRMLDRDPKRFRERVPLRRPDKCFFYFNGKTYSVTAAWGLRRGTARFKRSSDALRFARGLKCKVLKGSEYSRMPRALQQAIARKVLVIMHEDGYGRAQAFAAALSMALRGTLKAKKSPRTSKGRARISSKRKTR